MLSLINGFVKLSLLCVAIGAGGLIWTSVNTIWSGLLMTGLLGIVIVLLLFFVQCFREVKIQIMANREK